MTWMSLPLYLINEKNLDLQNQKYFPNVSAIKLSNCRQIKSVMVKKNHSNLFCLDL